MGLIAQAVSGPGQIEKPTLKLAIGSSLQCVKPLINAATR
jgi:hypothetical protein